MGFFPKVSKDLVGEPGADVGLKKRRLKLAPEISRDLRSAEEGADSREGCLPRSRQSLSPGVGRHVADYNIRGSGAAGFTKNRGIDEVLEGLETSGVAHTSTAQVRTTDSPPNRGGARSVFNPLREQFAPWARGSFGRMPARLRCRRHRQSGPAREALVRREQGSASSPTQPPGG